MSRRSSRTINLPAPYLKRVWLDPSQVRDREVYPFCLPIFPDDFELNFEAAITIIVERTAPGSRRSSRG
ncbi:putative ATPase [Bradyrhizobium sp. USDA 4486]